MSTHRHQHSEGRGQQGGQQPERSGQQGQGEQGGLGEMATAVKDRAQEMASSVASGATEAWDSTREGVQRAASAIADTAGDAWGDVTGVMRRYPFGTLFIGIGIGFLLAQVLNERRTGNLTRMGSDLYDRARDYASDTMSRLNS